MKLQYLASAMASAGAGIIAPGAPAISGQFLEAAGVVVPMPVFVMGLGFAGAGGFIAMAMVPPGDRFDKWLTICLALFFGLMTAIAHPHVIVARDLPIQLVMGLTGFVSRGMADVLQKVVAKLDVSALWKGLGK
jgi:hypothetical protein